MDDIDITEIVDYLLDLPGFRLEGLSILHQTISSAQDIMRHIFDPDDAVTTVDLVQVIGDFEAGAKGKKDPQRY